MPDTHAETQQLVWTPTRAAGLARLAAFLPAAGRAYAAQRNVDRGPADRSNVSALSPWIRRRLLTEDEVVRAVLSQHTAQAAEKFIQEVLWRSYWKGWLEARPGMLAQFHSERSAQEARVQQSPESLRRLLQAQHGHTGIECFDAWVAELLGSGWLHNHTRMWFASIWIFTLKLPWQLGAAFFYEHLLDADPASNTLSWRWVAGLHTPGKHYLARADNIRLNTLGRFDPQGELDEAAAALTAPWPNPVPEPIPAADVPGTGKFALLLTDEDLHPESWSFTGEVSALAVLALPAGPERPAARFTIGARDDALHRAQSHFGVCGATVAGDHLISWARGHGVRELVTAYAPAGTVAVELERLEPALNAAGIRLVRLRRAWDERCWPYATAGFFKLKARMPTLLADLRGR